MVGKNASGELRFVLFAVEVEYCDGPYVLAVTSRPRAAEMVAEAERQAGALVASVKPFLADQKVVVGFPFANFGASEFLGDPWENYYIGGKS